MTFRYLSVAVLLGLAALSGSPRQADAALNVFACEPEWASLVQELGGEKVSVYAATNAQQDPHQVQARPGLIARARSADLVVCTGAELEIGWMPVVLRQSGNARIQPSGPGYFESAQYVRLLDIPNKLDRAEGDVHAAGNPHIQTSPHNIRAVAVALGKRLGEIDGGNASVYAQRTQDFLRRWDAATKKWEAAAAPLRGINIAVAHKNWVYLVTWLGMNDPIALEPKPGVPAGPAYLTQVLEEIPRKSVRFVIYAAYEDARPSRYISEQAKIPAVLLPFTVGGTDAAKDLFGHFDDTIARLLAGLAGHD